jgi:hypothetical protein
MLGAGCWKLKGVRPKVQGIGLNELNRMVMLDAQ